MDFTTKMGITAYLMFTLPFGIRCDGCPMNDNQDHTPLLFEHIRDCWLPLTDARLKSFERSLPRRLSRDYREFLLEYNGGTCNDVPLLFDLEGRGVIGRPGIFNISAFNFYSVNFPDELPWRDIEHNIELHDSRIPSGTIPIGDCAGQNLLLLDLATGEMWLWERGAELTTPPESNRIFVASSFTAFVSGIQMESLKQRRSFAIAEDEPLVSIEAFDFEGFVKWGKSASATSLTSEQARDILTFAIEQQNYHVVKWLLKFGVDPSAEVVPGQRTPIEVADDSGCADVVMLLLEAGANPHDLHRNRRKPRPYILAFVEEWKRGNLKLRDPLGSNAE